MFGRVPKNGAHPFVLQAGFEAHMREFAGLARDYKAQCFYYEVVDWLRKVPLTRTGNLTRTYPPLTSTTYPL